MRKRNRRYQPVPLHTPISFGIGAVENDSLKAADELALFKLINGTAESANLSLLEVSCSSALHALNYAEANPKAHTLAPECLGPARALMLDCAAALLKVRDRERASEGEIRCAEDEREVLADLVDNLKLLRDKLPRRAWRVGVRMTDAQVAVPVPRALAEKHLGVAT